MTLILPGESAEDKKIRALSKLKEDLTQLQDLLAAEVLEPQISPTKIQNITGSFGFLASIYQCLKHDIEKED